MICKVQTTLAGLGMNLQVAIVQSSDLYHIQHQPVPVLEHGAPVAGHPPPLVPPLLRHVYNVTPSPLPYPHQRYYLEMVAGKAPPPAKIHDDMNTLERWILPMDDNFTITQTRNE